MNELKYKAAYAITKANLINELAKCPLHKAFKIGKTTQELNDRFNEDYASDYECIAELYDAGIDGHLVDWLEEKMIEYCQNNYAELCDNKQIGGGPPCTDNANKSHTAKLYVVIR